MPVITAVGLGTAAVLAPLLAATTYQASDYPSTGTGLPSGGCVLMCNGGQGSAGTGTTAPGNSSWSVAANGSPSGWNASAATSQNNSSWSISFSGGQSGWSLSLSQNSNGATGTQAPSQGGSPGWSMPLSGPSQYP